MGGPRVLEVPTLNQTIKTKNRKQLSMSASPSVRDFYFVTVLSGLFSLKKMADCGFISSC